MNVLSIMNWSVDLQDTICTEKRAIHITEGDTLKTITQKARNIAEWYGTHLRPVISGDTIRINTANRSYMTIEIDCKMRASI